MAADYCLCSFAIFLNLGITSLLGCSDLRARALPLFRLLGLSVEGLVRARRSGRERLCAVLRARSVPMSLWAVWWTNNWRGSSLGPGECVNRFWISRLDRSFLLLDYVVFRVSLRRRACSCRNFFECFAQQVKVTQWSVSYYLLLRLWGERVSNLPAESNYLRRTARQHGGRTPLQDTL